MAQGITQVADVIVPEIFSPYIQQITEEKSRLIQSGALVPNASLDQDLAGGGLTFNAPSFQDLDNDEDNVSTDAQSDAITGGSGDSTPNKIATGNEISVRLSRNNSWSSANLTGDLAGADPMQAIQNRVGYYWARRLQAAFLATMTGVFAQNATATDTNHVQNDMTNDVSGASYSEGVTDFSDGAFLDTLLTMGDSQEGLALVMVHSVVFNRMQKQNLIDYVYPSDAKIKIATYLNRQVIVDDGMPNSAGVFETWVFGNGAVQLGRGLPKVPTEVGNAPASGNGSGSETLYNRLEWAIHPVGYAFVGSPASGGPSNAATTNNLGDAASWNRVYPERKQIKIARLITREYAVAP